MKKEEREKYIFKKRSLLILLFIYYLNDVSFDSIILRSFGFHFDPSCDFKAIVRSKKDHIHKYVCHIFDSLYGVNLEQLDVMGNVNIILVNKIRGQEFLEPQASLNIYFTGSELLAIGYIEGKKMRFTLYSQKSENRDNLIYRLCNDKKYFGINSSASDFTLWLLKFFSARLHNDLVMGAGINEDYGAKNWNALIEALNNDFYKGDYKFANEIKHYVGKELFTDSMIMKTSGFDSYRSLNRELYEYKEAKSFDTAESTLSACVDFIKNHNYTSVITYNYDTNLEYLLKKRSIAYSTVYDDSSFINKEALVDIYHVHGLLPYDRYNEKRFTDSLIFNESEYFYLYNNPYSWNIAKQLHDFKFNVCLFIGISLTDPDMKRLLELADNYLKFNFIFLKKEKDYSPVVYSFLTSYFFSFDLIVIWVDEYSDIGKYLQSI